MRRAAGLLAALLAASAGAQGKEPPCEVYVALVESGTLRGKSDVPHAVRGGAYLTSESHLCLGKRLARLEAENTALRQAPVVTPPAFIVAVSVAFVVGAGAAYLVTR